MTRGLVLAAICLALTAAVLFWLSRPAKGGSPVEALPAPRRDARASEMRLPQAENPVNLLVDQLRIPELSAAVRAQQMTGREQLPDADEVGRALGEPVAQIGGDITEVARAMPGRVVQYQGTRTGTVVIFQVTRGAIASAASSTWERKGTPLAVPGVSAFRRDNGVLVCRLDRTVVLVMVLEHPGDETQALTALASAVAHAL